jgi:hypothetical protein
MMRFTITTPEVLKVLQARQRKLSYRQRTKPFNFIMTPIRDRVANRHSRRDDEPSGKQQSDNAEAAALQKSAASEESQFGQSSGMIGPKMPENGATAQRRSGAVVLPN